MSTLTSSPPHEDHTTTLVLTWAVLVGLTLASWWLSDNGLGPAIAITLILVLTFVKVFMVGHTFMELRTAPPWLKKTFVRWCVAMCVLLIALAFTL